MSQNTGEQKAGSTCTSAVSLSHCSLSGPPVTELQPPAPLQAARHFAEALAGL